MWGPTLEETSSFADGLGCVGDIDADGYDDLAVGAPWEGRDGRAYLYSGSPEGPSESVVVVLDAPNPSPDVPGANFGAALLSR